ncbi:MAG: ribonuclease P protein component [Bacteroidota bacterium]
MSRHRLYRQERLKKETVIRRMFNREGETLAAFPLRLIWIPIKEDVPFPVQFTLSVPKRNFKKAVDRNRIRRQVREAYRTNKSNLYQRLDGVSTQFALMVLFTGREAVPYELIERKMVYLLKRFADKVRKPGD